MKISRAKIYHISKLQPGERNIALFIQYASAHTDWQGNIIDCTIHHPLMGIGVVKEITRSADEGIYFVVDFPKVKTNGGTGRKFFTLGDLVNSTDLQIVLSPDLTAAMEKMWTQAWNKYTGSRKQAASSSTRSGSSDKSGEHRDAERAQRFDELCQDATCPIPVEYMIPPVDKTDLSLVSIWAGLPNIPVDASLNEAKQLLLRHATAAGNTVDLRPLISARLAEKTAVRFFRHIAGTVTDVSATQLVDPIAGAWKFCDLEVEGAVFDVKNARYRDSNIYSEHRIQKPWKVHPGTGEPPSFLGVISPFLELEHYFDHAKIPDHYRERSNKVLGIVHPSTPTHLKTEFEIDGLLTIDLRRPDDGSHHFIPHWMYDIPPAKYQQRDKALQEISSCSWPEPQLFRDSHLRNTLPALLAASTSDNIKRYANDGENEWQRLFIDKVLAWRDNHMLSLPFVFLTVLWHFVQMARQQTGAWHPRTYRSMLFWKNLDKQDTQWPLFVYDPTGQVDGLIASLETIWTHNQSAVRQFSQFQLAGNGIFRGRKDRYQKWQTLVAHCGQCGEHPLIWGRHNTCPNCGRLICEKQHCRQDCPEQNRRMTDSENPFYGMVDTEEYGDMPF